MIYGAPGLNGPTVSPPGVERKGTAGRHCGDWYTLDSMVARFWLLLVLGRLVLMASSPAHARPVFAVGYPGPVSHHSGSYHSSPLQDRSLPTPVLEALSISAGLVAGHRQPLRHSDGYEAVNPLALSPAALHARSAVPLGAHGGAASPRGPPASS